MCWNWYWEFSSRCMCLLWPSSAMPLIHICLDQMYYLSYWQKTQPLSHNPMIDFLIPGKINNLLPSYLCGLSLEYTFLGIYHCHNIHGHFCVFHNDRLFLHFFCYHISSVEFRWQFGIYQLNVDLHSLDPWASSIYLLYISHVIEFTCCYFLPCSINSIGKLNLIVTHLFWFLFSLSSLGDYLPLDVAGSFPVWMRLSFSFY